MNIAYSCNDAYIQHTGISLVSLLENNKESEEISIYFIEKNVSQTNLEILEQIVQEYDRKLIVIPFEELCHDLNISSTGRHIETVYAKLFFSRIKGIDKILYLDSDTIINRSLEDFWNIDINNYLVAGVETYTVEAKTQLNLKRADNFINDGIILMNLKECRDQNILTQFLSCIELFNGNPPVLSEGVINKVCKGSIKSIHPKYNLMSGLLSYKRNIYANFEEYYDAETIKNAAKNPVIIHFLAAFYNRPWSIYCTHPLKEKYLYYKSISPWRNSPLDRNKLSPRLILIKNIYLLFPAILIDSIKQFKKILAY